MATVRFGGIVADVSGRLGAEVFSRVGSTRIVRRQPLRPVVLSAAALEQQSLMAWLAYQWTLLSYEDQQAWTVAARRMPAGCASATTRLTGRAFFMRAGVRSSRLAGVATAPSLGYTTGAAFRGTINWAVYPDGVLEVVAPTVGLADTMTVVLRGQRTWRIAGGMPAVLLRSIGAYEVPGNALSVDLATLGWCAGLQPDESFVLRVRQWLDGYAPELEMGGLQGVGAYGPELLAHGGFEAGTLYSLPTGWTCWTAGTFTQQRDYPYQNRYSGELSVGAGLSQSVYAARCPGTIEAGHTYRVRTAYRIVTGSAWSWRIRSTTGTVLLLSAPAQTADGLWHVAETTFVASSTAVQFDFALLGVANVTSVRSYDWVSIRAGL